MKRTHVDLLMVATIMAVAGFMLGKLHERKIHQMEAIIRAATPDELPCHRGDVAIIVWETDQCIPLETLAKVAGRK